MKFYIILIVFSFQQLCSFPWSNFIEEPPLYCFEDELYLLFYNPVEFDKLCHFSNEKNLHRLKKLRKYKDKLLWHIDDPSVGLVKKECAYESLAWNFSLWDLAPKKGRGLKIALIDNLKSVPSFNENKTCDFLLNLKNNKENFSIDDLPPISLKDSLFFNLKNDFFYLQKNSILKNHGCMSYGIIKQLAPNVIIIPVQVIDNCGYASKESLCKGLEYVINQKCNFVHLGLKIINKENDIYTQKICQLIMNIPYVVAAAGNDIGFTEAFPASIETIPFDVGAFGYNYQVCNFSQYTEKIGPKVLAPGENILCQYEDNVFVMMSGTSFSSAFITGFLALVLAEFQEHFTYEQIISVIYQSAYKLNNDSESAKKSLLGIIDMRSSLFCFHVLAKFKKLLSKKKYKKHFSRIVKITYFLLRVDRFKLVKGDDYGEKICFFVNGFKSYARSSVESSVDLFVNLIAQVCNLSLNVAYYDKKFDIAMIKLIKNNIDLTRSFLDSFPASVCHRLKCAIER